MSFKKDLPVMMSSCGQFFTQRGQFFHQIDYGIWRQVEVFLTNTSPMTYGFATQTKVANWFFTRLSVGTMKIVYTDNRRYRLEGGTLKRIASGKAG